GWGAGTEVDDQPRGGANEADEEFLFVREPAAVVPALAEFAAAANGGDRIDAAEPHPGRDRVAVARPDRDAEAAVGIEQSTIGTVEHDVGPVHDGHRHARAVPTRDG